MSSYLPENDHRLDPRYIGFLKFMGAANGPRPDVENRDQLLAEANTPEALKREAEMTHIANLADSVVVAPKTGLRIEEVTITSAPDKNPIKLSIIRPDTDTTLPCIYYIHGGGMMTMSCFYGNYQTWGRLIAHHGVAVVMVDFRNALRPSSAIEVAPYPAGLNDCVSGFRWVHNNAQQLGINAGQIVIAGESGGGNLSIATTMKLIQDGHTAPVAGVYALCPYIAGHWPQQALPSSTENEGIFITVGNNRGAMAYGIDELHRGNALAWPGFATIDEVKDFPATMIRVNECDPLRDEGIAFYRLLLRAGVAAQCQQTMGTPHAGELLCTITPDISRLVAGDIAGWALTSNRGQATETAS
jgi:acetyl esterase